MRFIQIVFLVIVTSSCFGQDKQGSLKGTITDSVQKPLPYVTITLMKQGNMQGVVKKTFTNANGNFSITADTGKYMLVVSHIGFADINTPVNITGGEQNINGLILTGSTRALKEIIVTATKPLIEQGDDRITYHVENDPASKSESATDILRKTPFITVDGEGNVQMNGQSNFKILLNGRETSLFALNVKQALKSFPGAVISKIEVITSPSAKYDAEGIGGIINIVTRKKVTGYNGSVSSYYSTLANRGADLSLNIKKGKFGLAGNTGFSNNGKVDNHILSTTTIRKPAFFSQRSFDGIRTSKSENRYLTLEMSYEIDSLHVITLYGNLGQNQSDAVLNQSVATMINPATILNDKIIQNNQSEIPSSGLGTDFTKKYKNSPGKELSFRFNSQFSRNNSILQSMQQGSAQNRYINNTSAANNQELTLQGDFVQPLAGKQKLETGMKIIWRMASSDFTSEQKYNPADAYISNPFNTDRFNYHQKVYSMYASYSLPLGKNNMRLGIRTEHTQVNGDFISSKTKVSQSYINVVPNAMYTHRFSNRYSLITSYNMRLQRPYIINLNPFINNNDSLNISYGNPNLEPQVLHAFSIQNRFQKGKLFAVISINTNYTNTMIVQYTSFNPATGITSTTTANNGREFQTALGFNANFPIGEKINIGINSMLRYNQVENKQNLFQRNSGISGIAIGIFSYKATPEFNISGSGGFLRNAYTLVNSPGDQYFYQLNLIYKVLNDKVIFNANFNNFHRRFMNFQTTTENPDFSTVTNTNSPYAVIYFGVTWNFGKLKENTSRKKGVSNDDLL